MGQGAHEAMNEASTGPWVTVASFPSVTDLALVEAEFRERGLDHRLRDALSVQVAPHMSAAMGGIRLEVRCTSARRPSTCCWTSACTRWRPRR